MNNRNQNAKIIFGLKVKQLRMEKQLSFAELARASGMSVSYLNEIEKGKKYPKEGKLAILADTLGVKVEDLTSMQLPKTLAPIGDLLQSNFLNELPLDMFGIELVKLVDIIANSPLRVGAFIATLVELARNYALREENFYHGAMRAYQELHHNYFEEIEEAALAFAQQHQLDTHQGPIGAETLRSILENHFGYSIDPEGLLEFPALRNLRALYVPNKQQLLLNHQLSDIQKVFQFGKELGFSYLQLADRANTSSLLRVQSFDQVLNHFKASYFATAILLPREAFIADLREFFAKPRWDGEAFLGLMQQYNASPEMLFQRLTNLIPRFFGIQKLFFNRFVHNPAVGRFVLDKELHLEGHHHARSNGLSEHYCRRWLPLTLLEDLHRMQEEGKYVGTIVGAQRSHYYGTEDEYLCFTLARPSSPTPDQNVSVTIGLLINDQLRGKLAFLQDPAIKLREVNLTCERCQHQDCDERAVPASYLERREARRRVQEALKRAMGD